ncbi:MAG: hypothetical protein V4469_02895 [Patescibacteria group bacterium]
MKINLKKTIINLVVFFTIISFVDLAFADADPARIENPLGPKVNSLPAFFQGLLDICIQLGTIISVLAIMYGGFLYVTAQGDEEKLGKAYKTITWALVGTAILLGSRTIMAAVTDTVKQLGTGINN